MSTDPKTTEISACILYGKSAITLNVRLSLAGWKVYKNALKTNIPIAASNKTISALNFKHSPPMFFFPF